MLVLSIVLFWIVMGVVTFDGLNIHLNRYYKKANLNLTILEKLSRVPPSNPADSKNILTYKLLVNPWQVFIATVISWPIVYSIIMFEDDDSE